jgi:hypothetical protein
MELHPQPDIGSVSEDHTDVQYRGGKNFGKFPDRRMAAQSLVERPFKDRSWIGETGCDMEAASPGNALDMGEQGCQTVMDICK